MKFDDYSISEVIYALEDTVVARAQAANGERVVLKYQNCTQSSSELDARWQHEFSVLQSIQSKWVVHALDLKRIEHSLVLVLEDFGSCNLAHLLAQKEVDLADRMALAMQLCSAISAVHASRLIHGDISSKNVLVDVVGMRLKLCDFGLSTRLDHAQKPGQDAALRGTLEYMSPEQTGRTNLDVDYRSDFYSLGITLYELFSGRTPFQSHDPMTLLHAQIAIMPTPLHVLKPTIPEALSLIVQKLLCKSPDDRYQSSFGLFHDLSECAQQWHKCRRIELFQIAKADVPERFCVANKLYGRANERESLIQAFERVSYGRAELQLISGYSGIGKTALVSELHRPIIARRGYFIRGKCDQFARNQPYSALIQAFQQLLQQLAVEGEQRRAYWKSELRLSLGENAAAISELLPNLLLLIGTPEPLPDLPAAEHEMRFHIAFTQFVKALSTRTHPLALFLDDLQWVDSATLKLIAHLVSNEDELCTLIIGAYRDNEVDAHHPLPQMVGELMRTNQPVAHISLRDLGIEHVHALIADTLHSDSNDVAELAELCIEKTQGNPFFLGQFLQALEQNGDIHYLRGEGGWRWDIEKIRQRDMTDNVVSLMLEKLHLLPVPTQSLVSLAAHLGDSFDMRQLMAVGDSDAVRIAETLWPALRSGLVLPLNEGYKFAGNRQQLELARYRFLHDRVQQAAYALTDPTERLSLQLHSGRQLLRCSSGSDLQARLFIIVELLNSAVALITDPAERLELLALNIRAGVWAKTASAFSTAITLLRQARLLLGAGAWQSHPEQCLLLYKELAEAEYLSGNFDAAEALYPEAIEATQDVLAKVTLCLVQVEQYHIQGRFNDGYRVLSYALSLLGRDFPPSESAADDQAAMALFPQEYAEVEALLAAQSHASLLKAPEMERPEHLLEMRIYSALSHATYQTGRFGSFVLDACRMTRLSLIEGQCALTSVAYVAFVTARSVMGQPYSACYELGKLALTLAEQRDAKPPRLVVYQYFPAFYQHWGEPLANTYAAMERGFEIGQSGVNPLSTGYCALLQAVNKFAQGVELETLEAECLRGLKFLQKSRQDKTLAMLRYGVYLPVEALRSIDAPIDLADYGEPCATQAFGGDFTTPSIPLALYAAAMIRRAYLFDDAPTWQRYRKQVAMIATCLPDSPSWVEARFYAALGMLRESFTEGEDHSETLQKDIAAFELWAQGCSENFLHKALLLKAESARRAGAEKTAMDLYARAIDAAKDAEFPVCEALANELYARFWLAQNQRQLANNFIRDAYLLYRRWGARGKCQTIERSWPGVSFRMFETRVFNTGRTATFRNISEQTGLLDLQSLLKANQLLAKEIQLDSLLQKMLEVLLENAGAEHGAIILEDDNQLIVEAAGGLIDGRSVQCERISKPLNNYQANGEPQLPDSIIEYVRLTRAALVLNNPAADERFVNSRYLRLRQPKSLICLPVVTQGKLVALVYLENNLLDNAFTAKQQLTLELLSGQAAISLVNARLYENLEHKVQQRTEELRQMSLKDGLTGIANRRSFDERLSIEWRRSLRTGEPLSLLMLDIDHFKQYNDHYGHVEGDHCITIVAQTLQRIVSRPSDLVARYGGEEFAILLPESDAEAARRVAESALNALFAQAIAHAKSSAGDRVSVSIGICTMQVRHDYSVETLIEQADQALYQAKRQGRARYHQYLPKQEMFADA